MIQISEGGAYVNHVSSHVTKQELAKKLVELAKYTQKNGGWMTVWSGSYAIWVESFSYVKHSHRSLAVTHTN